MITSEGQKPLWSDDRVDYITIVATIDEGVIVLQEGQIVFANPAFCQLTGRDISDLTGISFIDLVCLSHKSRVKEYVNAIGQADGGQTNIEFQMDGASGTLMSMKMGEIRYGQGNAILGRLIDITTSRKKTLETQRLHIRLRSILDSIHHAVLSFSFDEAANKAKVKDAAFYAAHLVEMNPAAETLFGLSRDAFLEKKKSIFDFVHDKDKEKVLRHYRNLHKKGFGALTYRIVRSDRVVRWVFDYGKVEYQEKKRVRRVNRIIEDITAKKKILDELKANEKKYRRIFERSKDMIYIVDREGNFIDINPAGMELLGIGSKEEATLRNIKEFYADPQANDMLLKELTEKGESSGNRVMLWKSKGEIIGVDLNAIAKKNAGGKMVSYQGIVTNITEALRQKELESIAQLAGCFADDLASPLNTIMINLGATAEELADLVAIAAKDLNEEKTVDMAKTEKAMQHHFEELIDFNHSAMAACREIAARLKEIREEYWRLSKVPDGTGGSIYERQGKRAPKTE